MVLCVECICTSLALLSEADTPLDGVAAPEGTGEGAAEVLVVVAASSHDRLWPGPILMLLLLLLLAATRGCSKLEAPWVAPQHRPFTYRFCIWPLLL